MEGQDGAASATLGAGWDEAVIARLHEALAPEVVSRAERPYVAFDLDNTCIWQDIGESFLRGLLADDALYTDEAEFWAAWDDEDDRAASLLVGDPSWGDHVYATYEARCATRGKADGYSWAVQLMAGMPEGELLARAEAHVARALVLDEGSPDAIRLHTPVRALMQACAARGVAVWIVSASAWWVVQAVAARLGVPAARVLGNRVVVRDGVLTATIQPPQLVHEGKVQALREVLDHPPLLAFGDSLTDREMMEYATFGGVVVDRGVAALRAHAEARGWPVQPQGALARAAR